jgi:2-aminoadipate transaminase
MDPTMPPTAARFSCRTADLHASPIREILAVIGRPGMVSFAGGLPAEESFPALDLGGMPRQALQYGPSEGDQDLREAIAEDLRARGLRCEPRQVLVLSGSQQGIDLVAKLFVDHGTPVALECPTYLAALQVFRFFGARCVEFDARSPDAAALTRERPAFLYSIPTFQNPTGRCLDAAERDALARACDASGTTLFEDDPYRDLAYDACERTPVCARLERAPWVYQGSFSKSLAPGLRLGYLAATPDLLPMLVRLKQAADLHSSRVSQWLVLQQLRDPARGARIAELAGAYARRRDAFDAALGRHFGDLATWSRPAGGLFFWLALNEPIDTRRLLPDAIDAGVAFMPGEPFFAVERGGRGRLRLNFSHATQEQAQEGLAKLAALLRRRLGEYRAPARETAPVA